MASRIPTATEASKWRVLERRLRRQIGERWRPGDRLPPIEKLARDMGVGITNMRRAAKALTERGMLIAHPGAGTFVAPTLVASPREDDERAADLSAGGPLAGRIVHLLSVQHTANYQVREMLRAAADVLADAGATVVQDRWNRSEKSDLSQRVADAVMIFNPAASPVIELREDQMLSIATVYGEAPVGRVGGYDVVSIQQEQAGQLAGELARRLGEKEAVFLGVRGLSPRSLDRACSQRLAGFERGLERPVKAEHRLIEQRYNALSGARAAGAYLRIRRRPKLVFAGSDDMAAGFALALLSHDMEPGRDYQLIGFDCLKESRSGETVGVPLTAIAPPARQMGEAAAHMLVERARSRDLPVRRVELACTLFEGKSCG